MNVLCGFLVAPKILVCAWFSLLKAARVLQVWWKVAAHFVENLWLLVLRESMMQSFSLALNVHTSAQ